MRLHQPFSRGEECKLYSGAQWTVDAAVADCAAVFAGTAGAFAAEAECGFGEVLGSCAVGAPDAEGYTLVSAGGDAAQCGAARTGCEVFARGTFTPLGACAAGDVCPEAPEVSGNVFVQPYTDCRDPLPGEPAGAGPGGQVCTPVIVSGCTEPDRRFGDYASCDDVLTQRPYGVISAPAPVEEDDPRLQDAAWLAESAWVKAQAESCACGCCHTTSMTRGGASGWNTEAGPLWIDTVPDSGLAMLAGLAPSGAFGAVDALANNGFDRHTTGLPTTDIERMRRFLLGEYARRGLTEDDAARVPPFGGPLELQAQYEPTACADGVGIGPDGTLVWAGGAARYVYVLDADAENPGVPPNLDVPEGTRWLIDVPSDARALACGMAYGEVPEGARQRVPADGVAPALTPGETYYLYVLRDVGLPVTRCLFTYEGP
ncbi:MAG: proteinase inhibitor [bacterium]